MICIGKWVLSEQTLWKFVAENYTAKFDTLKLTLKNNIKEDSTENHTDTIPLLFRNAKNRYPTTFLSELNTISNFTTIHKLHRISYNHTENLNPIIIPLGSLLL